MVSCGSTNSGHTSNVIPDYLDLNLNVRTFNPDVREKVVKAIHRIIEAECEAGGAIEKRKITRTFSCPATVNDHEIVEVLRSTFESFFKDRLVDAHDASASEDFSLLAKAAGSPYTMWLFGGIDETIWDDAVAKGTVDELPSNHSPFFAPVIEPTLETGVDALVLGALSFLKSK